jgi:hypothetical protein
MRPGGRVFEHAAFQVTKPPGDFAVIVGISVACRFDRDVAAADARGQNGRLGLVGAPRQRESSKCRESVGLT